MIEGETMLESPINFYIITCYAS